MPVFRLGFGFRAQEIPDSRRCPSTERATRARAASQGNVQLFNFDPSREGTLVPGTQYSSPSQTPSCSSCDKTIGTFEPS